MVLNKLGGIYYNETTEVHPVDFGGSIPCFIGRTINPDKDYTAQATANLTAKNAALENPVEDYVPTSSELETEIALLKNNEKAKHKIGELQSFNNFTQVNRTTLDANGKLEGLGDYETEKDDNPLLKVIHDFCEETEMMTEEYVACPYFYVIDLGDAKNLSDWISSIETSKIKREIDFEIYVGFDRVMDGTSTASFESFILAVNYDIVVNRQVIGDFRKTFYTIPFKTEPATLTDNTPNPNAGKYQQDTYYKEHYKETDTELLALTTALITNNDSQFHLNETTDEYDGITLGTTNTIPKSRIYIIEPLHFGRTIGRITTTPYDMEPGYYPYNTITREQIIMRKPSEKLKLQMGGVIFNQLEETSTEEYVKINRTQSISTRIVDHPSDSLFQSRHLCDYLITKVFDACYPQIKNKETETNIEYLRTQVNKIVNDAITDGDFIAPYMVGTDRKGTFLNVQESSEDAYDLEVVGMIQPVNCTYSIHIIAQINDAKVNITQG